MVGVHGEESGRGQSQGLRPLQLFRLKQTTLFEKPLLCMCNEAKPPWEKIFLVIVFFTSKNDFFFPRQLRVDLWPQRITAAIFLRWRLGNIVGRLHGSPKVLISSYVVPTFWKIKNKIKASRLFHLQNAFGHPRFHIIWDAWRQAGGGRPARRFFPCRCQSQQIWHESSVWMGIVSCAPKMATGFVPEMLQGPSSRMRKQTPALAYVRSACVSPFQLANCT